jgi:hypothetical protein
MKDWVNNYSNLNIYSSTQPEIIASAYFSSTSL